MAKAYDPATVERRIYDMWMQRGYFTPTIDPARQPFTIILPPPNVTGELHLGHALTATVEDCLIRWHRMRGEPTLWLPGTDHASIAAQLVVERELAKEGLSRQQMGREAFLQRMWEWMDKYRNIIIEQHKILGASLDWTRLRFTMDPAPSRAVRTTFVNLYRKGLIYRGERIINWCPRCQTALSDLEVEHHEVEGKLYYVRYPLVEGGGRRWVTVATTRPETILGDVGVAVHPDDERYRDLVGHLVQIPRTGRDGLIVADAAVERGFGTGAVKLTPGHDPVDFEIGQRHGLKVINVMTLDGYMNDEAGQYAGLTREECRRRLLADLQAEGLVERIEDYRHAVGHCQRCGTVVEPLVSLQWFVRIQPLAEPAMRVVADGTIRIVPERFAKVYLNWMENIRDWCISRQLWWGHRIPVWYCADCGEETVDVEEPTYCANCGSPAIEQDPDVLDTWFSSGLWPHSTLGWPEHTEDLAYFYPTSVMETGYDILFFWVARMIMMGLENTGQIPFRTVYLHGMVRDEKGDKMSKTRGNVIDPVQMTSRFGTDALRFSLTWGTAPGNDMKLSVQRIEAGRNFANKMWNAARLVLLLHEQAGAPTLDLEHPPAPATLAQRWILARRHRAVAEVSRMLEGFQLGEAVRLAHDFFWGDLCDWYLEIAKVEVDDKALRLAALAAMVSSLVSGLKLLHPLMPFVTEEIWQQLRGAGLALPESLMIAPWPTAAEPDQEALAALGLVIDVVRAVRNARAEQKVEERRQIEAAVVAGEHAPILRAEAATLRRLAGIGTLTFQDQPPPADRQALALFVGGVAVYLPLAGLVDVEQEVRRLEREREQITREIARAEGLLANPNFVRRARFDVVAREREKLEGYRQQLHKLQERLDGLDGAR